MIAWALLAGAAALWIMSGPKRIAPPPGSRWEIDITATNIGVEELKANLHASTQAKGNRLVSLEQTGPEQFKIVMEYGKGPSVIWVGRPIHTSGGVVLTTVDARKLS